MEKKKNRFSKIFCFVAVLCMATLFSAIFVMQNFNVATAEQVLKTQFVADDYIIDDTLNQNTTTTENFNNNFSADLNSVSGISKYCLRDEYVIYTQDQTQNGLCWAFAGCMSVGTTLMRATGQYYDFSEAWIALAYSQINSSYVYGEGGTHGGFNSAIKNYGLVLESDMQYDNSFIICDQNKDEYFEYFSQYANKNLYDNLSSVSYDKSTQITNIKEHIYNYGSLELSTFWNSYVGTSGISKNNSSNPNYYYKCPSSKAENELSAHSISIIGWDDNVTVTYGGTTYVGAWICLNSWGNSTYIGNDGIIYAMYNDSDIYSITGYTYQPDTTGLYFQNEATKTTVNNSDYSYTTNLKGKYYTGYSGTTNVTKQNNVIFSNSQDINSFQIQYDYILGNEQADISTQIDSISIFKAKKDVSGNFNIQNVYNETEKSGKITIQKKSETVFEPGTYKIIINYSNSDQSESGSYIDLFYVMDGNEMAYSSYSVNSETSINNNGESTLFNSYNYDSYTINLATTKTSGTVRISYYPTTYSNISSVSSNLAFSGLSATNSLATLTKDKVTINLYYVEDTANNILTNFYYYTDGSSAVDKSRLIVNKTSGVEISALEREGYVFDGWYYDKDHTVALNKNEAGNYVYQFDKVIVLENDTSVSGETYTTPKLYAQEYYHDYFNNSSMCFVYAKWTIDLSLTVADDKIAPQTNEQFTLTVNLSPVFTLSNGYSVTLHWFKDDIEIQTTNNTDTLYNQLTQEISTAGKIIYYVKVEIIYGGQVSTYNSNNIEIDVTLPLIDPPSQVDSISFANGNFSWTEVADAEGYMVYVYCKINSVSNQIASYDISATSFKISDSDITAEGAYSIGVKAYKIDASGNFVFSAEQFAQNEINYYLIEYVSYSNAIAPKLVQEGTELSIDDPDDRAGYNFIGWFTDAEKQTPFVNGSIVTGKMTVYAKWALMDVSLNTLSNIEKTYNKQTESISVDAEHSSGLTNFEYAWFYKKAGTTSFVLIEDNYSNLMQVENVADSGEYYCEVTLTDSEGVSVTNSTNTFAVAISKATPTIFVSDTQSEYTYNAQEQTVKVDAYAVGVDGNKIDNMQIEYEIVETEKRTDKNKFIYVPNDGILTIVVKALGNENYKEATNVDDPIVVKVNKAGSAISVEKQYQFFRYVGKAIMPEYVINNSEQIVFADIAPVNVGEYDIVLSAQESQNYLAASVDVHITINPANIYIKANDVTGVLFAKKQQLSYSIINGEVYGNDDLGVELSTDVDTGKLGSYNIKITCSNANYKVATFEGTYRITAWPYYLGVILIGFLAWIVISALSKRRFQYDFETNGGNIVSPIDTKDKNKIIAEVPTKDGYEFVGWYTNVELTKPFNNKFRKSKGKTLYAKWKKVDGLMSLSEELKSAQDIVNEIQAKQNPKSNEQKPEQLLANNNQDNLEQKDNTVIKEQTMDDIINNAKQEQSANMPKDELQDFINKITE